jgi:predicted Rossmann-fold nucleotide-binding protein
VRVLVCGGRDYGEIPKGMTRFTPAWHSAQEKAEAERAVIRRVLQRIVSANDVLIHGAASGADKVAAAWAKSEGIECLPFPADWYPNGRQGGLDRSAGPRRNQQMLDEGRPDFVIAFPGGSGTADMVRRAEAALIPVRRITALEAAQ